MSREERALLEAFVVENEDLERLEMLLSEFNIFEALGAVRQELRHSDFLAFLLDPSQNHGLGDDFLKRFLKRVLIRATAPPLSAVAVDVADMREALIQREWRNIDILIHDPNNRLVCAIENKLRAGKHSDQLRRYRELVTREFPDHCALFLYLTPEGNQPSDEDYIPLSYAEIAQLVDVVRQAHESTLGADVRTLMSHYTAMLRRYIVSESEIAELCRRIYRRHKQALDLIFEHRPDLQWDLAEWLKKLIQEADKSLGFVLDHCTKTYIRFGIADWDSFPALRSGYGWTPSGRILLFEFQNYGDQLSLKLIIGPGPDALRKTIYQTASEYPRIFRGRSKRLSPKWTTIYNRRFLARRDYEDPDFEALTNKIKDEWEKFISQELPALREVVENMEWPEFPESTGMENSR